MLRYNRRLVLFVAVLITVPFRLVWEATRYYNCRPPLEFVTTADEIKTKNVTSATNPTSHVLPLNAIIVRAAYYDPRPRDSFPNTSVFLAEARRDILRQNVMKIAACGADVHLSYSLRVRVAGNSGWVHVRHPGINHDPVMIDCFGLPKLQHGTRVFLWVNLTGDKTLHKVESENPYFVPEQRSNATLSERPTIVVCLATVRKIPTFLKEFLLYYKHLEVDHVYMVAEDNFILRGNLEGSKVVKKVLLEGFVSFSFWHKWLNDSELYHDSQMLAYEDCIYRFQGTYDYVFNVDSDDHFIPLVSNQTKLDYYITHYCKNAGSCQLRWIEYYPDCGQDWSKLGPHGNVTNTLLSHTKNVRLQTKSIHLLRAILDTGIHAPFKMIKGYKQKVFPSNVTYVAHLRKNRFPPHPLSC